MAEYIDREAIFKAYMDLCRAKSQLAKANRGAAFFRSDLYPEMEPTTKEVFAMIMAMPAADVVREKGEWVDRYGGKYANPVYDCSKCGKSAPRKNRMDALGNWHVAQDFTDFCPNCGADMRKGENG